MSDLQVTNYGICGECRFHILETRQYPDKKGRITSTIQVKCGWVCTNSDSDYYTDYTEYTDTCEEWEQRGVK